MAYIRPWVEINGRRSTTVQGLLIEEVPAPSRPQMRTRVDEVDGRGGSEVVELGYSAYERDIRIGLFGEYSIDDVAQFFTQSGWIVFSNEPEKKYKFTQVSSIDFERLLRFHEATVTVYVQPLKYSSVEERISYDSEGAAFNFLNFEYSQLGVTVTADGNKVSIDGTPESAGVFFYIPVSPLFLGDSTSKAVFTDLPAGVSVALVNSEHEQLPQDMNNGTVTFRTTMENQVAFLQLEVERTRLSSASFTVGLIRSNLTLFNSGNIDALPRVTVTVDKAVSIFVNDEMKVKLLGAGTFILDCEDGNTYSAGGALANRKISGDLSKFVLRSGYNTISWAGTSNFDMTVENYSRWI